MIQQQPRTGDIGLTSILGPVGSLIRAGQWLTGSGFSRFEHAFVVVGPNQDGETELIEAQPGGAVLRPLSEYADRDVVYVSPPLTDDQREKVAAAARSLRYTPYSALDYAALAAHRFHLPAPGLRRYIADSGHMICSQLADEAYRRAGIELFKDGRWPGYVTPGDLWNLLRHG
ncbi:hypothetical protein [Streptomyces sp. NRRL S-350]|uniref:hypothetical protein n=1 Tax=Streptomyces sp. NRRL S-350 TaxID=1463902 RepID=UPI0004C001A3|nr:hypothetical protein [Streptomyces sp. NRRL S-350]